MILFLKKLIFPIYLFSAITFIATLIRDFVLIKYVDNYKLFFDIIYICSVASIGVNSIFFKDRIGLKTILFYSLFGLLTILFFVFGEKIKINIFLLILIFFGWLIGTLLSKKFLVNKNIFLYKFKDIINPFLLILFIFLNLNIEISILISIYIPVILLFYLSKNKKYTILENIKNKNQKSKEKIFKIIKVTFLCNITPCIFYYWALIESKKGFMIFNFDSYSIIRLSTYIFQFLLVASIATKYFSFEFKKIKVNIFFFILLISLAIISNFFNAKYLMIPILFSLIHYFLLFMVNKNQKIYTI